MEKKSGLVSPAQMGDKGNKGNESGSAPGGRVASPVKTTNAAESKQHNNGK
jgi:hypothetical protein